MNEPDALFGNDRGDGVAIRARTPVEPRLALAQATLIQDWLGALGRDVTAGILGLGSLRAFAREVRPWQLHLEEMGVDQPIQATVEHFLALQTKRYRVNTVNNRRDTLAGLYSWAQVQGRYPDIVAGIPRLTRVSADLPPESCDGDLVLALLDRMGRRDLRDLRNRVIVGLVGSGLETVSVHLAVIGDVDLMLGQLRYQPRRHVGKDAVLPMRPEVAGAVREYVAARVAGSSGDPRAPLITPSYDLTVPLSTLSMRLLIRRLADGLGVGRGRLTTSALRSAGVGELTQRLGVGGLARCAQQSRCSLRRMVRRVMPHPAG